MISRTASLLVVAQYWCAEVVGDLVEQGCDVTTRPQVDLVPQKPELVGSSRGVGTEPCVRYDRRARRPIQVARCDGLLDRLRSDSSA